MSRALLLLLVMLPLTLRADWPGGDYPEVRAFAYNLKSQGPLPIIDNGLLSSSATSKTGILLTPAQVRRLIAAVTGKHPSRPLAACFTPRHAFVFYDAAHTPRAWLEVCFECLSTRSKPDDTADNVDFPSLAELCAELGLPSSPGKDFRKGFDEFRRSFDKPESGHENQVNAA
jgi:hypothetical protein